MSKLRNNKYKNVIKAANAYRDWDYGYILDMEVAGLEYLRDLIRDKGIHVGNERTAERIDTAIKLLKMRPTDFWDYNQNKINKYVNLKNAHRFTKMDINGYLERNLVTTVKMHLIEEKAWYIYCKMRETWMRTWWD